MTHQKNNDHKQSAANNITKEQRTQHMHNNVFNPSFRRHSEDQRFALSAQQYLGMCVYVYVCMCVVLVHVCLSWRTSYIIRHTSYIHTSYIIHYTSYFIHHTSYIIHPYIIHNTSYIIHHTSYITHHTSYIISYIQTVLGVLLFIHSFDNAMYFISFLIRNHTSHITHTYHTHITHISQNTPNTHTYH